MLGGSGVASLMFIVQVVILVRSEAAAKGAVAGAAPDPPRSPPGRSGPLARRLRFSHDVGKRPGPGFPNFNVPLLAESLDRR